MNFASRLTLALLLLLACQVVSAQGTRYATIPRIEKRPTIDGTINPSEWLEARAIENLHQAQPVEYADPSQKTIWYIAYDSDALYVAAYAYDTEPDKIVAQSLRQGGSVDNDDSLSIMVDAFNNKRSGYQFSMNANGVRQDAIYASPTRASDEWDGIWHGAAEIVADGWTMEMAIPFKTLSFSPDNHIWGVNFERKIPRLSEDIAWSSRNGQVNPTVSGEVMGFTDLSQGVGLDIIPSVSSSSFRDHALNNNDSEANPSLDINYKLTPAINWLVTFNTDFAATEADSRQLDVGRFSLFFPEKRSFFLTDFDIFQFGGISSSRGGGGGGGSLTGSSSGTNALPFFSRRIGLGPDGEAVDLIAGSKLSGRIGKTDLGLLYVRQDEAGAADPADEDIDASDLIVARLAHGVLEESSVGAIFTHGDPTSNDTSSLVGLDFNYRNTRLKNNRSLEAQFWVQKTDNVGIDDDDFAYSVGIGMPANEGWEAGLQVHEVQENYDPRLGFANRTGVRLYSGEFTHKWINQDSTLFERVNMGVEFERWEYLDTGLLQTQKVEFDFLNVNAATGDFFRVGAEINKERILDGEGSPLGRLGIDITPGDYSFDRFFLFGRTARHRKLWAQLRIDGGDYYDGDQFHIRPTITWAPNKHLSFDLEYDYRKYDFSGQEATTRQITFNNTIAFNSAWSLLTLAQYDNLSDDIGINMRLRYNRSAGQDFWVVLNHNMRELDPDDGFRSTETIASMKIRYTFRF